MSEKHPDDELEELLQRHPPEQSVPSDLHSRIMGALEDEWARESRRRNSWRLGLAGMAAAGLAVMLLLTLHPGSPTEETQVAETTVGAPSIPFDNETGAFILPEPYRGFADTLESAVSGPLHQAIRVSVPSPSVRIPTEEEWNAFLNPADRL